MTGKLFPKPELADLGVTVTGAPGQDPYGFYDEVQKFELRFNINTQDLPLDTVGHLVQYLVHELPEDREALFGRYQSLNRTQVDVNDLDQLYQQTR